MVVQTPKSAWPADCLAERLAEARAVIADVAHHSDHLVRIACTVLTAHGDTEEERREARGLLFVIDGRAPLRLRHRDRSEPEVSQ